MVAEHKQVCIIDMGSSHVSAVIAEINDDSDIEILGFGNAQNQGMQYGAIIDMDKLVASLKQAVSYAEDMADYRVYTAWLCVSNTALKSFNCSGRVQIQEEQVTTADIVRTLTKAKQQNLLDDDYLVSHFQHGISINDNEEFTNSPLSMLANEIEAFYHLMMLPVTLMQNFEQAMSLANFHIEKVLLSNIASSSFALSPEERERGVCCVDIGYDTTNISVYFQNKLLLTKSLAMGGVDVTQDISAELKISMVEAEKLKIKQGRLNLEDIDFSKMIDIPYNDGMSATTVSVRELAEIMVARYEEILTAIIDVIAEEDLSVVVQRHVYCGGGSEVKNFARFAKRVTSLSTQVANFPQNLHVPDDRMYNRFSVYQNHTVCGALLYSQSEQHSINTQSEPAEEYDTILDTLIRNPYRQAISFLNRFF